MWSYRHEHFTVHQIPALRDNYIYLIELDASETLIAIDPAEAVSVRQACKSLGKPLTHILNTHHHWDHTDGNTALKQSFPCQVIAAQSDATRIPGIDVAVSASTPPQIDRLNIQVLELPGHTSGHIAYLMDDALFCGDVLFGAGCGRLFEGTHRQMLDSLTQLGCLPPQTRVYCAHEYTLVNLRFARSIEPEREAIKTRIHSDNLKRQEQRPTIPSTIGLELQTNPFLRCLERDFCDRYAAKHGISSDSLSVFTDLRERRNHC